jgi:hypothetical protein
LPFIQADALALDPKFIASFDAVHASPPSRTRIWLNETETGTNGRV